MILNSQNNEYAIPHLHNLTFPIDPAYLYPAKPAPAYSGFSAGKSYIDATNDPNIPGLDQLMGHRQEVLNSRIDMLYTEITQRFQLKDENLYRIKLDQCAFKNMVYIRHEDIWDDRRVELERRILDLEQEKRREKSGCFKDVLFLRKELRDTMIEKIEEEKKLALFAGPI